MLNAIVLSEDPAVGVAVQELASASRQVSVVKSSERPNATPYEIARLFNTYAPELTFIDLRDPAGSLALLQLIFGQDASAIVIGLGFKLPASWRQRFEEYGLAEYLEFPMSVEEFEQSVLRATRKVRPTVSEKLVAYLPAKAGSGSTTVAVNVAGGLAKAGKNVLLLEADINSGVLSTMLNATPSVPIVNVLAQSSSLDATTWSAAVTHSAGMDMLLTDTATTRPLPTWVNYHQLLRFALSRYDYIVADLPEVINSATEEIVRSAHAVMVVCTPEMLSLTLTRRRLAELHQRDIPEDRIHVVLNRWHSTDISVDNIGKILKHKIAAVLPNDYRSVNSSVVESTLITEDSKLGRSLTAFARKLTGEAVEIPKSKRTSWFAQK
jgi:pilus assembly protein CpaE